MREINRESAIILMYHGVTNSISSGIENFERKHISVEEFSRQMEYLSENHQLISLDLLVECLSKKRGIPKYSVVVTLDDGYQNNFDHAFPILKKYNVPATIFLTAGFVGTKRLFWVDEVEHLCNKTNQREIKINMPDGRESHFPLTDDVSRRKAVSNLKEMLKRVDSITKDELVQQLKREARVDLSAVTVPNYQPLTWQQVRQMSSSGISLGAHTMNHSILTRVPLEVAKREIMESKRKIEEEINKEVILFAYPNGTAEDFNEATKEILKGSGFSCGLTAIPGANNPSIDIYELRRLAVGLYDMPFPFKAM